MRMLLCGWVLTLMAANLGWAQNNNPVVEAQAVMATDAAHANSPLKLAVLAQVAAGYHINDHKPTLDYLIPTELKVDPSDQFTVKNVVYPKGTIERFAFSDVPLSVYENTVVVGALLQTGKAVSVGTYTLKAKFAYQACNDHACLPPTSVPLTVTLKIVPRSVPLKPVESDVFQRIKFE
ncbi:MAG TPA: protein-disulfide reductase DsbD domain-containing protein [Terriglobia bacterium]|nr:protein-disulfide reductase DsbD domain-containing protein [Terriglobia bacterium]